MFPPDGIQKGMHNTENLASMFNNVFLMLSFHEMDVAVWDAFQKGDTETVAKCSEIYKLLIADVCSFVAADNV
jgi:hypothetical protein